MLEVVRVMGSDVAWPVTDRVVDVGEHVEGVEAGDQRGGLRQVVA